MNNKELIKDWLNYDPLDSAERLAGESYKDNEGVVGLGMLLQSHKSEVLKRALSAEGDTVFNEKKESYISKVLNFGFKEVYSEKFLGGWDGNTEETFYIMFHFDLGILLKFDTFGEYINGGNFYYNWSPENTEILFSGQRLTSSGSLDGYITQDFETLYRFGYKKLEFKHLNDFDNYVNNQIKELNLRPLWIGDHDCREAIFFKINSLAENGKFLSKWKKQPFLWLSHYKDNQSKSNDFDYKSKIKERLNKLPKEVREVILVNE